MADDAQHAAVVESLKATASELQARPSEEMNRDWADRMADGLSAAGLLVAPAPAPAPLTDDQHWQWRASMIADLSGLDYVTDDDSHHDRSYFEAIADGLLNAGWRFGCASPAAPADDEATLKPDEVMDDGASWVMPPDLSEIVQRVVSWSDSGNAGVGIMTWHTTINMTSTEGRAIAGRLVAAADHADAALAALREGQ